MILLQVAYMMVSCELDTHLGAHGLTISRLEIILPVHCILSVSCPHADGQCAHFAFGRLEATWSVTSSMRVCAWESPYAQKVMTLLSNH